MREEVFGHLAGGGEVVTGMEPLYAWVRLSVMHVDPLRAPAQFPMIVQLSRNCHEPTGHYLYENGVTVDIVPERAGYKEALRAEAFSAASPALVSGPASTTNIAAPPGLRILEPDGKVRLLALSGQPGRLSFSDRGQGVYLLKVDLLAKVGDAVDLLLPMFSQSREQIDREAALGLEGALAQSEAFWQQHAVPVARFQVPEQHLNRVVRQSVNFAALLGAKDYVKGDYAMLSGS